MALTSSENHNTTTPSPTTTALVDVIQVNYSLASSTTDAPVIIKSSYTIFCGTILLGIIIITFNSLTLIVIKRTSSLQTLSNMYVSSLAAVDLIVGVALFPAATHFMPYVQEHIINKNPWICSLFNSIVIGTITMSGLHLLFISIERCIYIKLPYLYVRHVTAWRIRVNIIVIWIFGLLETIVPPIVVKLQDKQVKRCTTNDVLPIEYALYLNTILYTITSVVTLCMYFIIIHTAANARRCQTKVKPISYRQPQSTACTEVNTEIVMTSYKHETTNDIYVTELEDIDTPHNNIDSQNKVRQRDDINANSSTRTDEATRKSQKPIRAEAKDVSQNHINSKSLTSNTFKLKNIETAENKPAANTSEGNQRAEAAAAAQTGLCTSMVKRFNRKPQSFSFPSPPSPVTQHKASLKSVKFFVTVYGFFIICITPAMVTTALKYYFVVNDSLYHCTVVLASANSGANFLIFFSLNSTFRQAVRKIFDHLVCERV